MRSKASDQDCIIWQHSRSLFNASKISNIKPASAKFWAHIIKLMKLHVATLSYAPPSDSENPMQMRTKKQMRSHWGWTSWTGLHNTKRLSAYLYKLPTM